MAESSSPHVIDVAEQDFITEVIEKSSEVPVIVDFWAEWCGPCRTLGPILEKLANEAGGRFLLAKVDADEAQQIASQLRIQSLPTVIAFKDKQFVDGFAGLLPEPEVRKFLESVVGDLTPPEAPDPGVEARAREAADPVSVEAEYRQRLEKDADDADARLGLARLLLKSGDDSGAEELLSGREFAPEHSDEQRGILGAIRLRERAGSLPPLEELSAQVAAEADAPGPRLDLGVVLAANGSYEAALDALISAAELDKTFAREKVREVMVDIFYVIGVRSTLADDYRSRLSRLLY